MDAAKKIILLFALVVACALPASALTPSAPENRVWEKITGTQETHQEAAPQVPQSHQEEAGATAENVSECFLAAEEAPALADGSFSISNWKGYPDFLPKPTGPMRLLEGDEYAAARAEANQANAALREQYDLTGMEIHEIQPVKFGGSPTDISNKIPLPTSVHRSEVTPWWNAMQRSIEGGN